MDNNQNKQSGQFQVDLPQEVGKGVYSNFAIIAHSSSEFVLDFAAMMPGMHKAQVVRHPARPAQGPGRRPHHHDAGTRQAPARGLAG